MIVNRMRRIGSELFDMYPFDKNKVMIRIGGKTSISYIDSIDEKIRGLIVLHGSRWYLHYLGRKVLELTNRKFDRIELSSLLIKKTLVDVLEQEIEKPENVLLILRHEFGYAAKIYKGGELVNEPVFSSYNSNEMPDAVVALPDEKKMVIYEGERKIISEMDWEFVYELLRRIKDNDPVAELDVSNVMMEFEEWRR